MKPTSAQAQKVTCSQEGAHWVVSCGSASVKIYHNSGPAGQDLYVVVYYLLGKRRRDSKVGFDNARAHAEKIVADLARGDAAIAQIEPQDRVIYARAKTILASQGIEVDEAATRLTSALKKLGARSLEEAVEYFARHNATVDTTKTVPAAVDEFLAAKQADGRGVRHLRDLSVRLKIFAKSFQCPIASVTTNAVSDWLRGLKCSGRSRNNYRNSIRNLFSWAAARRIIAADQINWDSAQGVARAYEQDGKIEIFTPEELVKLINAARLNPDDLPNGYNRRYAEAQGLLPYLILGAFVGLRASEICAQAWLDIDLAAGYLRVTQAKRNTPSRRLVPLSENCKAWLRLCQRSSGVCCTHRRPEDPIKRLAVRAGVAWKRNALRHSFISYRIALTKNCPQVAAEAGNSPKMIDAHYRELVTEESAKAWFSVAPDAPSNVVALRNVA